MSGYGGGPYGGGPYGGSFSGSATFEVETATSTSYRSVRVTFSSALSLVDPAATSIGTYDVRVGASPLPVYGVVIDTGNPAVVTLYTAAQTEGAEYTVTVWSGLEDASGNSVDHEHRTAVFTGIGAVDPFVVSELTTRTLCAGNAVSLSWKNPTSTDSVTILRRTRSWPFDTSDASDVVYSGSPIESYEDTGLPGMTFYYYVVYVLKSGQTVPDMSDDSRTVGLALDAMTSSEWLTANTPQVYLERDAKPASEGGGDGFLAKWFAVMGCWLNLMRGMANSVALLADDDQTPWASLPAKNAELGLTVEGLSYDYATPRRVSLSAQYVYRRKGSCIGAVEAVRMFTGWDAVCTEFGDRTCNGGPAALSTWDGVSLSVQADLAYPQDGFSKLIDLDGRGKLYFDTYTPDDGLLNGGHLYGPTGDVACIASNGHDVDGYYVITEPPQRVTEAVFHSTKTMTVTSADGLYPGMRVQLISNTASLGTYATEVATIASVTGTTVAFTSSLAAFVDGESVWVSIAKSVVAPYESYDVTAGAGTHTFTTEGLWYENQWTDRKAFISGTARNVVGNTTNTVTFDGAVATSATVLFGTDFTPFPVVTVRVTNGTHSYTFNPLLDAEERGTRYDPFSYFWMGPGASLAGSWGPYDVGVYVTSSVPTGKGRASTVSFGSVFTLDVSSPALPDVVGMYLNPNQNQEQLFEIIEQTPTTITVAGNISSLVVAGQQYVILSPRNANRFKRISARLKQEFSHSDVRVHVLFS